MPGDCGRFCAEGGGLIAGSRLAFLRALPRRSIMCRSAHRPAGPHAKTCSWLTPGWHKLTGHDMSAISSHDLTGTLRTSRKSRNGFLMVAGITLAPFALLGSVIGFGVARGGIEPYMILAAWLLG